MWMLTSWLVVMALPAVIYSAGHMPQEETLLEMFTSYLKEEGQGPDAMEALMKAQELMKHMDMEFGDLPEEQRMHVIQQYMEQHMPDEEEENMDKQMTDMLKDYIDEYNRGWDQLLAPLIQTLYQAGQALIDGEDIDEVADMYLKAVMDSQSLRQSPDRRVLNAIANHLRVDPDNDRLQMMLIKAYEQVSSSSEQMLMVNVFNFLLQNLDPEDPLAEVPESLLEHMMEITSDITPRKAPTLMLQHYVLRKPTMVENMAYLLSNMLLNFNNPKTYEMAGKLAYFVANMRPEDVPEDERWKWNPPTLCRLMTENGQTINMTACPDNAPCGLGPAMVQISGANYMVALCEPPMEYVPYQACRVVDKNGTVHKERPCPDSACNLGPFPVMHDDDQWDITFCLGGLSPPPEGYSMAHRACSMTDEQNYVMTDSQNKCPMGYKCDSGPIKMDDGHAAMMCRKVPDPEFEYKVIDMFLGPKPEDKSEEELDKMFMDFVIDHISAGHAMVEDNMNPDAVGLMILEHFLDMMEETTGSKGLPGEVYEILMTKKSEMMFSEKDQMLMQKMIMYFIHKHQESMGMMDSSSSEEDMGGPGGPDMPGGPQGGANELLIQMVRMLLNQQQDQRQPPQPPRPGQDMGDLAEALLNHVADHHELAQNQARHGQILDELRESLNMMNDDHDHSAEYDHDHGSAEQSNQMLLNAIREMMNSRK